MASAAEKVARILETVTSRPDGVSVAEAAQALGVTREAAARFLRSLVDVHLLDCDARTDLYFLGIRLIGFGSAAVSRIGPIDALYDPMIQLSSEFRVPVMLTVTRGADTYILLRAQPSRLGAVVVHLGHSRATYATAAGRVFLAFGNRGMLPDITEAGMEPLTAHTIHTEEGLEAELEKALRQGYLTADEEANVGQHVIAVPVLDHRGRAVASLAISLIDRDKYEQSKAAMIGGLLNLAQTASRLFAYGHGMVHAV